MVDFRFFFFLRRFKEVGSIFKCFDSNDFQYSKLFRRTYFGWKLGRSFTNQPLPAKPISSYYTASSKQQFFFLTLTIDKVNIIIAKKFLNFC